MESPDTINILLVEDEEFDVRRVRNTLAIFEERLAIRRVVSNGDAALELLRDKASAYDIIILDYQIAGGLRGENLIRKIKDIDSSLQIIVITKLTINFTDLNFAQNLMQAGAYWYCTKYPGDIEEYIYQPTDFVLSIFNAYERRVLEQEKRSSNRKLIQNVEEVLERKKLISSSPQMEQLQREIEQLAQSNISVLITGASGTGKELVANNIHYRSSRKFENFVPINCGSIPAELIESELFGYEKGAFTGASSSKKGLFELANNGTLFLDEVAELPLNAQVKLLRVIQEGEIEKIGRTKSSKVDVRIIAATNKDLEAEVEAKRFREDLYYRLNVVPLHIPPLVVRKDDIKTLTLHYLNMYSRDMNKIAPVLPEPQLQRLMDYDWPGNVRELKNVMQRIVFYSRGEVTHEDIDKCLLGKGGAKAAGGIADFARMDEIIPLRSIEKQFRKEYFEYVRQQSESDVEAAKKLGLAPPNFHRMCKELGIK